MDSLNDESLNLGDAAVTADITASYVILEDGKQIKVDLTAASNTASGSTFNAKNGDSTVTYTITGDSAISVGDTVATFTADGSKTLTFSAADKSAATAAGAHTETLTFDISVENAVTTRTVTWNASDIVPEHHWDDSFTKDGITFAPGHADFEDKNFMNGGTFTTASGKFTKIEVTADYVECSGTGWSGSDSKKTWTGDASSSVSYSDDIFDAGEGQLKIVFTIEE